MKGRDIRSVDKLYVFRNDHLGGILTRTPDGSQFTYASSFLHPPDGSKPQPIAFTLGLDNPEHITMIQPKKILFADFLGPNAITIT